MQKPSHRDQGDTTACRDREDNEIQVQCLINSTDVLPTIEQKWYQYSLTHFRIMKIVFRIDVKTSSFKIMIYLYVGCFNLFQENQNITFMIEFSRCRFVDVQFSGFYSLLTIKSCFLIKILIKMFS